MTDNEFKGRLREMLSLQRRHMWYQIGQVILGALTAVAVITLLFLFLALDG
jgi:hypothetical protein